MLCALRFSSHNDTGEYTFSIEMTQMTAACTAELWVSTDADPLNLHKVLVLEYNDLVCGSL